MPGGGCSFQELCEGTKKSYACDHTVDISGVKTVTEARDWVIEHIESIFLSLITECNKEVEEFYIGKTSIRGKKIRKKDAYKEVDPTDPGTWVTTDGIAARWHHHHGKPCQSYARDGMVVLAVVTQDTIPQKRVSKEDIAFALEQQLLHHFLIDKADKRCKNTGFAQGSSDNDDSPAYVVYMTFSLGEELLYMYLEAPSDTETVVSLNFLHKSIVRCAQEDQTLLNGLRKMVSKLNIHFYS